MLNLRYAVKIFIVYLRAQRHIPPQKYAAYARSLRHILQFYGYNFPLRKLDGQRVLHYADIYDPYSERPLYRERGRTFWMFVHWLKKNEMIPAFTAKQVE